MAKHVIIEQYTFTPATRTIVVTGKNIRREQLLLITNTTTGTVIYNFSDPSLGATSYVNAVDSTTGQETTTIVLAYATAAMSSTDKISILTEETYQEMIPAETMRDPVDKLRVSTPQSLIDTDFEYGTQPTKWESLNLINNRPSAFYDITAPITITNMTASAKIVTVATTTPPAVGTPVFIQGTLDDANVGGWWLVETVNSGVNFTFTTINTPAASLYDATKTYVFQATFYTGAAIPAGTTAIALSGTTATVTTTNLHGLRVGDGVFIAGTTNAAGPIVSRTTYGTYVGTSGTAGAFTAVVQKSTSGTGTGATFNVTYTATGTTYSTGGNVTVLTFNAAGSGYKVGDTITLSGANLGGVDVTNDFTFTLGTVTGQLNGSWVVATVPTVNTFTFACTATGTPTTPSNACVYPRALGYMQHRAFDGGVQFTNVSPYHGYQVIRQTRRQFRYQSGKAIQFSTGTSLKPALTVDTVTASGTTVTVTTKYAHGISVGAYVKVSGANETAYNGTFVVTAAATPLTFTYTALSTPSATPATGFPINISPFTWYGSSNRVGMFDQQNGVFFEYDGQTLYAVRRNSTQQISGVVTATNGATSVTGTSTKFSSQLKPGDYIVIRGMSYLVQSITSDTQMYIYPEYRGTTASSCVVSKTIDTRYAQSTWNIDRCDGTGASLYNVDLTKMQMFYIDYTWYGAGAIRFGFKNNRGEVVYAHRIPNNNVNLEAYLRSGNLPARYETNTIAPKTYLTATLTSGVTASMSVADTSAFPAAGTLIVYAAGNTTSAVEFINYTGKTATTLTGLTRNVAGGTGTATTFTYSATAPILVESHSPSQASTISHWGSSVIMDGRYDDDKSIQFNYGMNSPITYATQSQRYPVFSIRLAPSVDNGLTGLLGAREILNRMQLQPIGCGVYSTGAGVKVEIFLNARVSGGTFAPVGGSSLAQFAAHTNTQTVSGGESIFTFFVPAGSTNTQDLSKIRDIGNAILGGGTSLNVPTTAANLYPDGPDMLTVCVTPLASNAAVVARLNWTEAQA